MSAGEPSPETGVPDPLADALLAARLCALDPAGLGGLALRGGGESRDAVVDALCGGLPPGAPLRRVPVNVDRERLTGGLDLAATLASGGAVTEPGLIAQAAGGALVLPMAERVPDAVAGALAAALDGGSLLVALDDGAEPDERPPDLLSDRLAFHLDLGGERGSTADLRSALDGTGASPPAGRERADAESVAPPTDDMFRLLAGAAAALGIESARAPLFALRAARASAALKGRRTIEEADLDLAVRLVLGPRATRLPAPEQAPSPPPDAEPESERRDRSEAAMEDRVLAAVAAALPPGLLDRLNAGAGRRRGAGRQGAAGERRAGLRGRPLGARAGRPGGGQRLSLIDTLRAAASWQKVRGGDDGRIRIRRDDLRVRRFETRAGATTIFAVDASGSAALTRLAEAKGAVGLLLARAYVQRAEVALVAFRGGAAELLLPPTRSLARARRLLADLPGGGGTPVAAGLAMARAVAEAARARGRTPFLVVLTDGRANVALDGGTDREAAQADAEAAARAIAAAGWGAALVDVSPRPRPEGERLAAAMGARYLPLPYADAGAIAGALRP